MKQVIASTGYAYSTILTFHRFMAMTYSESRGNATFIYQLIPTNGVITDFRIKMLSAAPSDTEFNIYVNGAIILTATVASGQTTGYAAGPVSVSAGDRICITHNYTGTTGIMQFLCCCYFQSTTQRESICVGCSSSYISVANPTFFPLQGSTAGSTSETMPSSIAIMPTSGKFKKLYVRLTDGPGAGDTITFTLRKSGADTALAVTISDTNTTGNDSVNEVSVSAGEDVCIGVTYTGTPYSLMTGMWGLVFQPDNDGESIVLGCNFPNTKLSSATTLYNSLPNSNDLWTGVSSLSSAQRIYNACVMKKLYVELSASPYVNDLANDWYKFDIIKDSTETGITCTIADGGTGNKIGNDVTDIYSVSDGDLMAIKATPNSSPLAVYAAYGLVSWVSPYPTGAIPTFVWPL